MPTILFEGKNYRKFYFKDFDKIEVIQGGDPLLALKLWKTLII